MSDQSSASTSDSETLLRQAIKGHSTRNKRRVKRTHMTPLRHELKNVKKEHLEEENQPQINDQMHAQKKTRSSRIKEEEIESVPKLSASSIRKRNAANTLDETPLTENKAEIYVKSEKGVVPSRRRKTNLPFAEHLKRNPALAHHLNDWDFSENSSSDDDLRVLPLKKARSWAPSKDSSTQEAEQQFHRSCNETRFAYPMDWTLLFDAKTESVSTTTARIQVETDPYATTSRPQNRQTTRLNAEVDRRRASGRALRPIPPSFGPKGSQGFL